MYEQSEQPLRRDDAANDVVRSQSRQMQSWPRRSRNQQSQPEENGRPLVPGQNEKQYVFTELERFANCRRRKTLDPHACLILVCNEISSILLASSVRGCS